MNRLVFFAAAAVLALPAAASAAVINIQVNNEGYVGQNGSTSIPVDEFGANHIVGNCGRADCQVGEFRDWFTFSVGDLSGQTVNAITFNANTDNVMANQGPVTVQFTSFPSLDFAELGNGTIYGSASFAASQDFSVLFNSDAVADLGSGNVTFGVSGRVIGSVFGPDELDSLIFGSSGGDWASITVYTGDDHPVITPPDGGDPGGNPLPGVPEPATWALMILGFGSAGAMLRRERQRIAA